MSKDNRGSSAHADGGATKVKKALFFGGSTPFLWASTKEMGSKGRAGHRPHPTYRRTRTKQRQGSTSFARGCVCAVPPGRSPSPLLPVPPHFFALAQRNGVEPQRNALLGAATAAVRSRPPLPRTRSHNITADCVKLTRAPGQPTKPAPSRAKMSKDNRGSSAHANGGAAEVKKALFFGGSTPFLWASTKEMGSKGRTGQRPPPNVSAHT